ncbi:hypothetical protein V2A60_001511 [Cordyceps javanica]
MASTPSTETVTASPAQIAALAVSVFAIIVFTSISVYLCGHRKGYKSCKGSKGCEGCKEVTQGAIHRIPHVHHQRQHTSVSPQCSKPRSQNASGGRFSKLKEAFCIKVGATTEAEGASRSSAEAEAFGLAPRIRDTLSLRRGMHSGTSNTHNGTEEFQAAVNNLLGYRPEELQEWYPDSDNDGRDKIQPEREEEAFFAVDLYASTLPAYEEVAGPRRFSWQGHESDYRPEKR